MTTLDASAETPVEPGEAPVILRSSVSRRDLLKGFAMGGATVAVVGTGAAGYRVFDTRALSPGEGSAYDAWGRWKDPGPLGMIGAALLAANPHNAQAWRFQVSDTSVDVFADTGRGTGTVDGLRREMYVGLGCALENLVLAGQARGYRADLTVLPDPDSTHVGHLALAHGPGSLAAGSALYESIGSRHSNRGPYQQRAVPGDVLAALGGQNAGLNDVGVRWLTAPADLAAMGTLMVDAARAITEDAQQSRDAFVWFRSTADAIQQHKDGLTLDGQGLNPMMTALAKLMPASSRTAGDTFWLDQTRTVHTRTAAAYGVIMVPSVTDRRHQLSAGRLLQRIHLDVTRRGMALQHMNQITERIDRETVLGVPATFAPRLASLLGSPSDQALVAFRLGYPVRAGRQSPRRPVTAVQR
jgi:hypothetical protein